MADAVAARVRRRVEKCMFECVWWCLMRCYQVGKGMQELLVPQALRLKQTRPEETPVFILFSDQHATALIVNKSKGG
jgi:hypothetical protein